MQSVIYNNLTGFVYMGANIKGRVLQIMGNLHFELTTLATTCDCHSRYSPKFAKHYKKSLFNWKKCWTYVFHFELSFLQSPSQRPMSKSTERRRLKWNRIFIVTNLLINWFYIIRRWIFPVDQKIGRKNVLW